MINEQTSHVLQDPRIQRTLLRMRGSLSQHPRVRASREALEKLPEKPLPPEGFKKLLDETPVLEKIVRELNRPALLVKQDSFEIPIGDVWAAKLNAARSAIERAIRAVGRIELREPVMGSYIGTGWLIAPDVVVTNRHVAREFARRQNGTAVLRTSWVGRPYRPLVDFHEEYRDPRPPFEFELDRVIYLAADDDKEPDVALLGVKPGQGTLPDPIPLTMTPLQPKQSVAVIGYPAYDPGEPDPTVLMDIFDGIFDVKRLAPGEVMVPPLLSEWFFKHDASTLGGNSGSVVLDLDTGGAIGLHFSGTSRIENYAVSADALAAALRTAGIALPEAPARPPAAAAPAAAPVPEKKLKVADYVDREGYDPDFLGNGIEVPLPAVLPARQTEIAQRVDGSGPELQYCHFTVVVNGARRFAMYTGVNIDGESLKRVPGTVSWKIDPRIAEKAQVGNEVYENNNLDKGHMVRRLDPVWGTDDEARLANDDTYHYANACPQDHTFNDQTWGDLEDHILDSAPDDLRLCVLTGPVLAEDDPDYRGIQVPRSFWKIVAWRNGTLKTAAFLLTQDEYIGNLEFNPYRFGTYQVTLAQVGEVTGLDFGPLRQADVLAGEEAARPKRAIRSVEDVRM